MLKTIKFYWLTGAIFLMTVMLWTGLVAAAPVTLDFLGYISRINTYLAPDTDLAVNDPVLFSITYDPDELNTQAVPIDFGFRYTTGGGTEHSISFDTTGTFLKYANYGIPLGALAFVDWDQNGNSGAIQGPEFVSTIPNALSNWTPQQMVLYLPSTPTGFGSPSSDINDYSTCYARMDWVVSYDDLDPTTSRSGRQAGIYTEFSSITVTGQPSPVPIPSAIGLLALGLSAFAGIYRRK